MPPKCPAFLAAAASFFTVAYHPSGTPVGRSSSSPPRGAAARRAGAPRRRGGRAAGEGAGGTRGGGCHVLTHSHLQTPRCDCTVLGQSCTALAIATQGEPLASSGRRRRSWRPSSAVHDSRTITQARARSSSSPATSTSGVEAAPHAGADVAGDLVPAVPEQRGELVVRVAGQRLRVDRQPGSRSAASTFS